MSARAYPALTAPGRIGAMSLRNRFVVTAMGVGLGDKGGVWGERIRAYHEEQARGGAAMIISGSAGVAWPAGSPHEDQVAVSEDRHIDGLARVVEAVHAHGAKFAVQLHHGGPNAFIDLAEGWPLWVPSLPDNFRKLPDILLPEEAVTSPLSRVTKVDFKPMTLEDIGLVTQQFAAAARRAAQAGADGVEIHGGHGYLLAAFLSPRVNQRTDAYGGPLENRARLLVEVIQAVRDAVGPDFPVWCKLDREEVGAKLGVTLEEAIATARMAEAAGVDAITVTANAGPDDPSAPERGHTPQVKGVHLPAVAMIKGAVKVPIISAGRVELDAAETAIAAGRLDFVAMGRKILADPALPMKAADGRTDEIRPCIYCYTCISNIVLGLPMRCAVNPRTSFERDPEPRLAGRRRIVVVGGGPAGMEAARRLAGAGQEVVLVERENFLGGTLRIASIFYEDNEPLLEWLCRGVEGAGIDVRLKAEVTPEMLLALAPDVVLVATGARRSKPPIPGADHPHVFSGDDLRALMLGQISDELSRKTGWATRLAAKIGAATGAASSPGVVRQATRAWMPLGQRIVVVGADLVGLELAEFLAERGRAVTVLDDADRPGAGLQFMRRVQVLTRLKAHGVELQMAARELRIDADAVRFTSAEGAACERPADHVILAKGATADPALANALRAAGFAVVEAGDCTGVGYLEGAMRGAAQAVRTIAEMTPR